MIKSPFRIEISTEKTLFVVANIPFVKEISRSVVRALQGEELDFSFYKNAATEKALEYISTGKDFIESIKKGEYKHQAMDISVLLTAPIFLIPESIFYPEKPCLIIDSGAISLTSALVSYSKEVNYKELADPDKLYDRYLLGL